MKPETVDTELQTLLDLDGQVYWFEETYWVKFDVCKIAPDKHRPHGIKYSLTLHDRNNTRLLGYDNAHATKLRGRRPKKYTGRIVTYDHVHRQETVERYLFVSAGQLLTDFWDAANKIIEG